MSRPMTSTEIDDFMADMENPAVPPPATQSLKRLNDVIAKWEDKIAKREEHDTEYEIVFSGRNLPPTLTRQNASRRVSDS